MHTHVAQGGLCVCVCVCVCLVLSLRIVCVSRHHPEVRTSWLTAQDSAVQSQDAVSGGCDLVKDGRDRLCLQPVDPAYRRRTVWISWEDCPGESSPTASRVSCADAMGC